MFYITQVLTKVMLIGERIDLTYNIIVKNLHAYGYMTD